MFNFQPSTYHANISIYIQKANHFPLLKKEPLTDSPAIQRLNKKELGYNYPLDQTTKNLANILKDSQHHWLLVFVDDKGQEIKGYVHAELYETTYFAPMFNILALAVDSFFQGKGIGHQLMRTIGKTAQSFGIKEIRLNSSTSRPNAHQFYKNIGYQKGFGKKLD